MRDAGSLGDRPRVLVAIPYPSVQWVREYEWHDRHSRAEIELVVFEDTGVWETASSASLPITLLPKRASAVLESSAPDVVVIHGLVQPKAVRSIRRFCSRHGIPFVVRTDGNIVRETVRPFRHRVKRPLYRRVIRAASAIAVAGTQNRRFYESFTSADEVRHREVFLPFRLDIDSLDTIGPGSRSEARAHFGLEDSDTVVTVVSRVSSEKGIDLFVDAMDGLAGRARAAVGLIAGSGPQMEELGRRSRALGRVRFLGHLPRTAVTMLLAASDLFVLPSRRDAWGFAVNEAAAFGLPMVVSDAAGAAVDLVSDDNGWTFPSGDPAALRDALESALATPAERLASMGRASRSRLADWYASADLETAFDRLVASALSPEPKSSEE